MLAIHHNNHYSPDKKHVFQPQNSVHKFFNVLVATAASPTPSLTSMGNSTGKQSLAVTKL